MNSRLSANRFIGLTLLYLASIVVSTVQGADVHYFGQTDSDIVSDIPYGNNPQAGRSVLAEDARIYYEVYGEKNNDVVLVLHGGGVGCAYEMGRFIDLLSKHRRVIVPSTRGQGKSEIGSLPITYERKANDMLAVVNQETSSSFDILGFSDGAYVAYKIATMRPERVKKIVAIGAGENIPATRKFPNTTLEELAQFDKRFVEEKIALCPEPEKLPNFLSDYYAFFNAERISKEIFGKIQASVLFIVGELDLNAPLDTVVNAYKMTPHAQLAVIPNAPHQAFIVNFDAVWACVEPFLLHKATNE
ncbi:MAG: alpha/beta hydrolase [Planctomycetia bacterium]|nr:alpha/beta hydrolase [Planctomycetia bacterium]